MATRKLVGFEMIDRGIAVEGYDPCERRTGWHGDQRHPDLY
jgi:hypothetical protein